MAVWYGPKRELDRPSSIHFIVLTACYVVLLYCTIELCSVPVGNLYTTVYSFFQGADSGSKGLMSSSLNHDKSSSVNTFARKNTKKKIIDAM